LSEFAIEARGLSKSFGNVRAVRKVDLRVRRGEIYGFLGRNGAGKTTTIRMLLGLIRPTGGEALVLGGRLSEDRERLLARVGCFVESASAYPNLTVRENLDIHRRLVGAPASAVGEIMGQLKLEEYADRRAAKLSLGNRQRLSLARAMLHRPELLILDEPANGLDPAGIVEVRGLLRRMADEEGATVFMSSHLLDEVEQLADRVGIVHEGVLVEEVDRAELRRGARVSIEVAADEAGAAARALEAAGIRPLRQAPVAEDLESRFMRLTGGAA
jgi:ABC-2 type transport system ATP-binding protein